MENFSNFCDKEGVKFKSFDWGFVETKDFWYLKTVAFQNYIPHGYGKRWAGLAQRGMERIPLLQNCDY